MKKYLILLFTIFSFSIFAEKSNVTLDIQKLSKYFKESKIEIVKGEFIGIKKINASILITFLDEANYEDYKKDIMKKLIEEDDYYIFDEKENMITFLKGKSSYVIKTDPNVNIQFTIIAPMSYWIKNEAESDIQKIYKVVETNDY